MVLGNKIVVLDSQIRRMESRLKQISEMMCKNAQTLKKLTKTELHV